MGAAMKNAVTSGRCRPGLRTRVRAFSERPALEAERHRHDLEVGRCRRSGGRSEDAPPPVQWPDGGWQIKPDYIVEGPTYEVPAKGHRRVDVVRRAGRLHEGHVGHVDRGAAEPARGDASRVSLLHPAHSGGPVQRGDAAAADPARRGGERDPPGGGRGGPGDQAAGPTRGAEGPAGRRGISRNSRSPLRPERRHGVDRRVLRAGTTASRLPSLQRGEADPGGHRHRRQRALHAERQPS